MGVPQAVQSRRAHSLDVCTCILAGHDSLYHVNDRTQSSSLDRALVSRKEKKPGVLGEDRR